MTNKKNLGNVVAWISPTNLDNGKWDVYVEDRDGRRKYALLQCCESNTRGKYRNGATFQEAEEIVDALQTEEDLNLVRGTIPEYLERWDSAMQHFKRTGKSDELESLTKEVKTRTARFREIGSKYFEFPD